MATTTSDEPVTFESDNDTIVTSERSLRPGERVVLFPSYGRFDESTRTWRLLIRGAIFDPREVKLRKRVMLRLFSRMLSKNPTPFEQKIFRERIETFVASTGKARPVVVEIGSHRFALPDASHRNGSFSGTLLIPEKIMEQLRQAGWANRKRISVVIKGGSANCPDTTGQVHLIEEVGVSVISDIDDTIKHTNVASRRELLANTFLREFRVIDGMADVYRELSNEGAVFHYVTSSPWQLYVPLAELCAEAGFPCGTFHLRNFTLRDQVIRKLAFQRGSKSVEIKRLLEAFPRRQFILVGDSGEQDPEIYARMAQQYPKQVIGVFIRQLKERPFLTPRIRKIAGGLPIELIRTFDQAHELGRIFNQLLKLEC